MGDLLVGFGLVLVIEGVLWAVCPWLALKMLKAASETPEQSLQVAGTISVAAGVLIVWAIRG